MGKNKFDRLFTSIWQQIDPFTKNLVAGAATAEVVSLDITPVSEVSITIDVSVAALSGIEVWVRGGNNGRWFPLRIDQLDGRGRTDDGDDIQTTPAGQACILMLKRRGWSDVMIKAKSDGAAKLVILIGGQ